MHISKLILVASAILSVPLASASAAEDLAKALESASAEAHPLQAVVDFAEGRLSYLRDHIRDYSCRLVKRERINGHLQDYQYARVNVRCEQSSEGVVQQPMAVWMHYLAPAHVKDRCVLYVDGQNEGKVLVRKGGRALKFLQFSLDPFGDAARRESNYPITEIGFDRIIQRLVQFAQDDMRHDPRAENTKVNYFQDAKVGQRLCTRIQIDHPDASEGLKFHQVQVYIDDELQLPIRLVVYDWPTEPGAPAPLLEEYTYVDLKTNVGLTEEDFARVTTPIGLPEIQGKSPPVIALAVAAQLLIALKL